MATPPSAPPHSAAARLAFGDCVLDLAAERLSRGGAAVPLQPRYFAVLVHLVGSGGRLVGKDELLDAVWGHRSVSDSVLKVAINAVRAALGDNPKTPRHVETVARRGYRFISVVRPADVAAPVDSPSFLVVTPATEPLAPPAKGNLPAPLPGLIGREGELAALRASLASHRVVTLHGPGGVGKTRLALAAAGFAAPADGVWLLRLEALADAGPLLATVVRTLGLGAGAESSPDALARALAGMQLRLVLDNAEHLQPAVAALAAALLAAAPEVGVLVTSQLPLQIDGEHRMPLGPLPVPADGAPGEPSGPALQLLQARAHRHQPGLALDEAEAADAAAICRALDGLPLALELAAARVPLLGWRGVRERLNERLGERLQLLTRGKPEAAERHRSLRAALDWTWGLLDEAPRRLLGRLSLFAGSFDVDDAVALAAEPAADPAAAIAVIDELDQLRECALLVHVPAQGRPRWRLYDSVRAYAAERLAERGDEAQAARRLVDHMIAVFEAADTAYPALPLRRWLAGLQQQVPSLRAAMQRALADPALHPAAVALFSASAQFRVRGGWRRDALQDHAAVLAILARRGFDPTPLARAGLDLAEAQLAAVGQVLPPVPALEAVRRAQPVLRAHGDTWREHLALGLELGLLVRLQAETALRPPLLERMRALESPGWGTLHCRQRIWHEIMLLRDQGELADFERCCAAYIANSRAAGDENSAWVGEQALSQMMAQVGRTDEALALLASTTQGMRSAGVLRENAQVLAQWVSLRVTRDGEVDTLRLLAEAVSLMQAEGRLWWMGDALAWPAAWQGRWEDAVRVQAWADALVRERGDRRGMLFSAVRARFASVLSEQPDAARLEALLAAPPLLDEAGILATAFAVPVARG